MINVFLAGCHKYHKVEIENPHHQTPTATIETIKTTRYSSTDIHTAHASKKITETVQPTRALNQTPGIEIVWKANFENGDLNEFEEAGGFVKQGPTGSYSFISPHAHSGNYSIGLTIDTIATSKTGNHAAYLFYWNQLPGDAYYYSAWYYIPSEVILDEWWNIMQWKSTYDGNTDNSDPIYVIGVSRNACDELRLDLGYLPDKPNKIGYHQNILTIPLDKWFQIEVFYKRSKNENGRVTVWQNGFKIFDIQNTSTVLKDETIYWSVNNYTNSIKPNPLTIFIDDMVISKERLGIDYTP